MNKDASDNKKDDLTQEGIEAKEAKKNSDTLSDTLKDIYNGQTEEPDSIENNVSESDNAIEDNIEDNSNTQDDIDQKIKELENERVEVNDKYMRLYAEFDNYRKRMIKEKEDLYKYGSEGIVSDLLTVIDNLEMALSHVNDSAEEDNANLNESLHKGVEMTYKELKKVLEKAGLSYVKSKNEKFDPQFHHAMSEVQRDDIDDKTIVEEFRKGYMFKDRLMRPAIVSVSKKTEITDNNAEVNDIKAKEEDPNE